MLLWGPIAVAHNVEEFKKDGTANVKCECAVRSPSTCPTLEEADASQIYTWHDFASVKKGMKIDLCERCYRRKYLDDGAKVSCCEVESDQLDDYYRGSLYAFE